MQWLCPKWLCLLGNQSCLETRRRAATWIGSPLGFSIRGFQVGQSLSPGSTDLGTDCCFLFLTNMKGCAASKPWSFCGNKNIYLIWGVYLFHARYSAKGFANITSNPTAKWWGKLEYPHCTGRKLRLSKVKQLGNGRFLLNTWAECVGFVGSYHYTTLPLTLKVKLKARQTCSF